LTIEEEGLLMMRLENDLLDIKGGLLDKLVSRLYHASTETQGIANFLSIIYFQLYLTNNFFFLY